MEEKKKASYYSLSRLPPSHGAGLTQTRGRRPRGEATSTGSPAQGGRRHLTLVPSFLQRCPAPNNTHTRMERNSRTTLWCHRAFQRDKCVSVSIT